MFRSYIIKQKSFKHFKTDKRLINDRKNDYTKAPPLTHKSVTRRHFYK